MGTGWVVTDRVARARQALHRAVMGWVARVREGSGWVGVSLAATMMEAQGSGEAGSVGPGWEETGSAATGWAAMVLEGMGRQAEETPAIGPRTGAAVI